MKERETYPEFIPTRFPKDTKKRLNAVLDRHMLREEVVDVRVTHSSLVRRAVREFLEREEKS